MTMTIRTCLVGFVCLLLLIKLITANVCVSKTSCKECITSIHSCAWCLQSNFDNVSSDAARCDYLENLAKTCDVSQIYYPKNRFKVMRDHAFKPLDTDGLAVQIKPQNINIKLRPHTPFRFNISYQLAEDYPVDLYFLMDLSNSMIVHKDKLSKLGQLLAQSMRNITKNFRLGFGSFVEKETIPFVNTAPRSLNNPCTSFDKSGGAVQCVPPYGYQHHMTLTDDSSLFEAEVNAARVSGNLDAPEGGLDALMQVIVCHREIGWRPASRKLIVFSTDAGFHYAGDGKLAGIVEPNDGVCHLDPSTRRYTHGLLQDYPSIGEINYKIAKNNINLIFAVVKEQAQLYKNLSELIEGSFVGELDNDSSNIVKLVVDIYKAIAKKITFTTESLPEGVQVKFFSKCQNNTLVETNSCDGLRIKEKVDFEVELTLTKCPDKGQSSHLKKPIVLSAQGLSEQVHVNVDAMCECECERDYEQNRNAVPTSAQCNNRGKVVCGICECDSSHYGNKCECSKVDAAHSKSSGNDSFVIGTGNISTCIK